MFVFVLVCINLCLVPSFAIILKTKREMVALLLLSYICLVTVYVFMFVDSSLRCRGLVCNVLLWYSLIKLPVFYMRLANIRKNFSIRWFVNYKYICTNYFLSKHT